MVLVLIQVFSMWDQAVMLSVSRFSQLCVCVGLSLSSDRIGPAWLDPKAFPSRFNEPDVQVHCNLPQLWRCAPLRAAMMECCQSSHEWLHFFPQGSW